MTLRDLQPEPMAALDAVLARAQEVVDVDLLDLIGQRIESAVAGTRERREPRDAREAAVCAVIDQMLVDVSRIDDETVRAASSHFPDGGLADLVMASYALEARTRLRVSAEALLGGLG